VDWQAAFGLRRRSTAKGRWMNFRRPSTSSRLPSRGWPRTWTTSRSICTQINEALVRDLAGAAPLSPSSQTFVVMTSCNRWVSLPKGCWFDDTEAVAPRRKELP
jgi:hypothetical protein